MRYFILLLVTLILNGTGVLLAQPYSTLIKGGHVIDPKNNINEIMDVAI
jgi:dihydroorotase